ncbi:MAG: dienelactone hydrolase family protein [Stellaceae bacterium]
MREAAAWRLLVAAALLLAASVAARAEDMAVPVEHNGRPITLAGGFDKPAGAGPFPAVILLHGCGGNNSMRRRMLSWAELLHGQGYATLILDSFTARGQSSICHNPQLVPELERARDVYAAAYALAARDDVTPDRIAAMGFSHGGGTVVTADAVGAPLLAELRERLATRGRLAAVVALYPGCHVSADQPFASPLLILIGEKDDWTPAARCQPLAARPQGDGAPVRLQIYPDAYHDFDAEGVESNAFGHRASYNAAAAAAARQEVTSFLREYLK